MITDYVTLQAAIQKWLNRADAETVARIPEFIQLAEQRLQRRQEWFEERYSVANGQVLTVTANPQQLPNAIRRPLVVFNATSLYWRPLTIVPLEHIRDLMQRNLNASGIPQYASFFTEAGQSTAVDGALGSLYMYLWPTPDLSGASPFSVDLQYVRRLPPLADNSTNALLAEHPDLYLYGALLESAPYLQDDDRIPMWEAMFDQRSREVDIEVERRKFGASPHRARLPNPLG